MRASACLLLAAVAVAACGGEASHPGPGDAAIARRAVLRLADLPHGWMAERGTGGAGRTACRLARAQKLASGRADSGPFISRREQEVESAVYVYRDAATARRVFARLTAPAARQCYESGERSAADANPGVKVLLTDVAQVRMAPLGDQRGDARITVVFTQHRFPAGEVVDLVCVRSGRGLTVDLYSRLYVPVGARLRRSATGAEVRRLSDALDHRT